MAASWLRMLAGNLHSLLGSSQVLHMSFWSDASLMVTHACRIFAFTGGIFTGVASCLSGLMPHGDPCLQGICIPW